jgi:uncharacterized protein (TIGR02147 family)
MTDPTAEASSFSSLLKNRLTSKQALNTRYSLRAFARDLGISPARLCTFMKGSSLPGREVAERVLEKLCVSPDEAQKVIEDLQTAKETRRKLCGARLLTEAEFREISSWEYAAILCLLETSDASAEIRWIAGRLNIDESVASRALSKLLEMKLVRSQNGRLVPTHTRLTTTHDVPSKVLRDANRQALEHAIQALESVPQEFREVGTITAAVSLKNLEKAKELARDFRRKIAMLLENGERSEVYNISVEIVPVTQIEKREGSIR